MPHVEPIAPPRELPPLPLIMPESTETPTPSHEWGTDDWCAYHDCPDDECPDDECVKKDEPS